MIDRRMFLGAVPAAMVVGDRFLHDPPDDQTEGDTPTPGAGTTIDRWGVQLYTVRTAMQDDLDATLEVVAEIGYAEVELFGLWGLSPGGMRAKLDGLGLRAVSSHPSIEEVRGDWARYLDDARVLGQSQVVVPSLGGDDRTSEGLRRVADDFNRAGEAATAMGLRFGYHNHDWELRPLGDGRRPMDVLLERTDPALVDWQMDIFWTVHGGGDPMAYFEDFPGRFRSVHVKDRTPAGDMVDVGDGVIDFARILARAERDGLRHAFVEHDNPADPIESIRRSFRHLSGLGGNR
jgi:sugar phosphate isomerase/epimerase